VIACPLIGRGERGKVISGKPVGGHRVFECYR
jgi:hypothetical protein